MESPYAPESTGYYDADARSMVMSVDSTISLRLILHPPRSPVKGML